MNLAPLLQNALAMIAEADRQLASGLIDHKTHLIIVADSEAQIERLQGIDSEDIDYEAEWDGEASLREAESGKAQARMKEQEAGEYRRRQYEQFFIHYGYFYASHRTRA